MRIADLTILIAVVWLTAVLSRFVNASKLRNNLTRTIRDTSFHGASLWSQEEQVTKRIGLTYREIQSILRREGGEEGLPVDCCPTVEEITEPTGGKNRNESYVELYRGLEQIQRFYEYSCRQDVLDKPCRFVDRKLSAQSRCVQKFSYSYAIVKNPVAEISIMENENMEHHHRHRHEAHYFTSYGSSWTVDHIRVRSGCSCEIIPKPKKKRPLTLKSKKLKHKPKKKDDFIINSDV
ncbi:uncharacterized protein LOC141538378 isoform X2 [Cotesia typhae]|uniref:uncharacterized protein LOC141538378 isoform X2 n=1 Tax=Cotesia typhae TaxID=2053667 RepID=UPI003D69418D